MLSLIQFWYLQSPGWTYQTFLKTIDHLEGSIGVKSMIQNISKPLFQDYSIQGRLIGLGIRIMRICLGGLFYGLIALLFAFLYLFWLLFPFLCLVSLVGSVFGYSADQGAGL